MGSSTAAVRFPKRVLAPGSPLGFNGVMETPASTAPRVHPATWLGWGLMVTASAGGLGTFGMFALAFFRPHAFGHRDGQGAAVLAVMVMAVALGVGVVAYTGVCVVGARLRARVDARAWNAALAVPWLALVCGVVASLL